MMAYNTMVVLVGTSLLGASSGLVGGFAVLRRQALMGDALSHAALPGLCLAFLVLGQRSLPAMLLGALLSGIVGIAIIAGLKSATRIKEDAAIGIVLSVFYGAGIVLSRIIQNRITTGSKAGLETYILGTTAGIIIQDIYLIAGTSALCLVLVTLLYKEFKVVAFDHGFAGVQGLPTFVLDLLLTGMIAVTVVIGLPAVGVVLMVALLILPAASARFWTERLGSMLFLSTVFGLTIGIAGTLLSSRFSQLPAGPVIVLVGSCILVVSLLLAPRRGLIGQLLAERSFRRKNAEERLLRVLFELHEQQDSADQTLQKEKARANMGWSDRTLQSVMFRLEQRGDVVSISGQDCRLTTSGWKRAAGIEKVHRLWQLLFDENPDLAATHIGFGGDSLENQFPTELIIELEAKLKSMDRLPGAAD